MQKARFQITTFLVYFPYLCTSGINRSLRYSDNKKQRGLLEFDVVGGVGGSLNAGVVLTKCQGDCDGDFDCAPGLKCMSRYGDEPVPGCSGVATCVDFCYDPNDDGSSPTTASPSVYPTNPIPTPVPTNKKESLRTSSHQPLDKCTGDCRNDPQCKDGLVCYQRNYDGPVPGCLGDGFNGVNFCIDPKDNPSGFNSDDRFSLKMYWEVGYKWQGETFERPWCMKCGGGVCNKNDHVYITACGHSESKFRFLNQKGNETQIQISNTNLCLEMHDHRDHLWVGNCDEKNAFQYFNSGEGDFLGFRFELSTPGEPGCLATHHQPKDTEAVQRYDCDGERGENTSYWVKYD